MTMAGDRMDRRAARRAKDAENRARSRAQLYDYMEGTKVRRRWASRRRRRMLAVALLATVLVGAVAMSALGTGTEIDWPVLLAFFATMGLGLVFATQLNVATRDVPALRHTLDERQRAEQDTASRRGHQATTWLLAVLLAVAVALYGARVDVPAAAVAAAAWATLMLHLSLPEVILAWTQPDEVVDDAEE